MSTIGETLKIGSLPAAAALAQFRAVALGSGGINYPSAGGSVLGILGNVVASGDPCHVMVGFTKGIAGAAVTRGDHLKATTTGKLITATAAEKAAGAVCAQALETVTTDGDAMEVFVYPNMTSVAAAETVTSGALNVGVATSYLSVTSTVAYTLADGTYVGQRKRVECSVAATTPAGTLTLNDAAVGVPTAWVFNTVGQWVEFEWTAAGWKVNAIGQMGKETVANAGTCNPLCLVHSGVIADTVDFILAAGLVAGQRAVLVAASNSGTPVGTWSGVFYTAAGAATGTDINMNAGGDNAYVIWDGAAWWPVQLTSATVS